MKRDKRKLQLERITVRPLNPAQLRNVQGGTADGDTPSGECEPPSMTPNMSVKNCIYTACDC